jgi:ribonuclease BN (tRNA processing enzyme)
MKLTVLGSGTSAPSAKRCSAGLWLEVGPAHLRLDCGAGTLHAAARLGLPWENITHQFISHFHIDHCGELPALLFGMRWGLPAPRTAPLALVGPVGLRALLEALSAAFQEALLEPRFPVEIHELPPGGALDLGGGATLRVHETPHNAESLAARVDCAGRSFGYTGDTAPSDELAAFFAGVDLLVAECSFLDDPRGTRHLTPAGTGALATRAGARRLVATHAYFDPEAADLAARLAAHYAGPILLATDGLAVEI